MIEPSYLRDPRPIRDVQVETLNKALSDEILRHARTRLRLLQLLQLLWVKEALPPAVIERKTIVRRVEFTVEHVPVQVVRRPLAPADEALRARQAAVRASMTQPLRLRSGAVLDPDKRSASLGGAVGLFNDSSWLALCLMAQNGPAFTSRVEIRNLLSGENGSYSSVRAAIVRARGVLTDVGAVGDVETDPARHGWRLHLARKGLP